ncbi:formin-binding protein 4 isoform X2 [Cephus cinctus]|uniref:Formin-binding protein 4 isoform X2 n=1 Tax=Cephus cinctus TaxID=211228 RepID=A0AAJ7CFM6_CEPCN|nr:formin-binding protein 4 isoform X2 [Cephus cinctus]
MKRRQRRPVLDINGEQSDSPRRRWQNKYQQIAVDHPEQNGLPSNPLVNLLGQYNSDSETEDTKQDSNKLDDQVNDFFKEIQLIAPEQPKPNMMDKFDGIKSTPQKLVPNTNRQQTLWQECFDESTGYPYYWHTETNEVTWEMPVEMRLLRENTQESTTRVLHAMQWANFSSNTYPQPQTNIPEGMIPKEVVARNRNRQVGSQRDQPQKLHIEQESPTKSGLKDNDLDDGKIEMITSFGNDESESDESDIESKTRERSKETVSVKMRPKPASANTHLISNKKVEDVSKNLKIGPALPPGIVPMVHGPENASLKVRRDNARQSRSESNDESEVKHSETHNVQNLVSNEDSMKASLKSEIREIDISQYLKSQAKVSQSDVLQYTEAPNKDKYVNSVHFHADIDITMELEEKTNNTSSLVKSEIKVPVTPEKEIKFSLVAGYSDDSDVEEEISPKKSTITPLFPSVEYQQDKGILTTSSENSCSNDGVTKKIETKHSETGNACIYEYKNESTEKLLKENGESQEMNVELDTGKVESLESEEAHLAKTESELPKPNKFLENLETPAKAFQRKKRIAFDVTPNKTKSLDAQNAATSKPEAISTPFPTLISTDNDRHGLGFQKELRSVDHHELIETSNEQQEKSNTSTTKSGISFVKGETINVKEEDSEKNKEIIELNKQNLKCLTETIMEKLKFLSEGSHTASAVQVMAIQLQTLLGAWEAGDLKENYLHNWLTGTSRELGRLEQAAAPSGWDCQWDRSHKRYYYRNSTSGETQWTYPEADVIGGTEEMDLCTTPPPQDQEEPAIIEQVQTDAQGAKNDLVVLASERDEKSVSMEHDKNGEVLPKSSKDLEVPPPPQISSPSPPPPPRIFAEDLKKGKKRRGSISEKTPDIKKNRVDKEITPTSDIRQSVNPPLPPSPPKPSQPPLPPYSPLVQNPPNSEPLPPGVDAPDITYPMANSALEPTVLYTAATQQTNPIYAATIGDTAVPIIDHHAAIMQGQLMHYPAYHQHLHNAIIAAANRLSGQEAVQFVVADYTQVYTNSQIIAKPPIKTQRESLGSALDSFYSDIASIEKTNIEQEQEIPEVVAPVESVPSPSQPQVSIETPQIVIPVDSIIREKKKKKAKIGVSKKQKEMSSMVAKWQKAQQHFEDGN